MRKLSSFVLLKLVFADCSLRDTPSTTRSGYTCQRWDANWPHQPKYRPGFAKHNKCANPEGADSPPWCYTTDPSKRWDYCVDVEECPCEWKCINGNGALYNGTLSTTISGRHCQRWDAVTPHNPKYRPAWTNHNYCRNPNGIAGGGPFCYTTDPNKRFEYCTIPQCSSTGEHPCQVATTTKATTTKTTTTTQLTTLPKRRPRPTSRSTTKCGINFTRFSVNTDKNHANITKHDAIGNVLSNSNFFPGTKWSTIKQRGEDETLQVVNGAKTRKGSLPHQVAIRRNRPPHNRYGPYGTAI